MLLSKSGSYTVINSTPMIPWINVICLWIYRQNSWDRYTIVTVSTRLGKDKNIIFFSKNFTIQVGNGCWKVNFYLNLGRFAP